MSAQTAWLAAGTADPRALAAVTESLSVELALAGGHPALVAVGAPPFCSPPLRVARRDRFERHFEHFTHAQVPGIGLETLEHTLADQRQRGPFLSGAAQFDSVLVHDPGLSRDDLLAAVDGLLLLVERGTSTASWVYHAARKSLARKGMLPIAVAVVNARHLEEAAVAYQELHAEIEGLLEGGSKVMKFVGFLRIDPDELEASCAAGLPLVSFAPAGPFHGQVKHILANLGKCVPAPMVEPFFSRLATSAPAR